MSKPFSGLLSEPATSRHQVRADTPPRQSTKEGNVKHHPLAAIGLGLLVLAAVGAIASAASSDGQIHACKIKRHGFLRQIDAGASCKRTETAVS